MDRRTWVQVIVLGLGAALARDVHGVGGGVRQGRESQVRADARMVRVEPMVGDQGPLSLSLRRFEADLRLPQGFDRVYRVAEAEDPLGQLTRSPEGHVYARIMGGSGLMAVFPRSDYAITDSGTLVNVPPGTTYYLGGLPKFDEFSGGGWMARDARVERRMGSSDLRRDARVHRLDTRADDSKLLYGSDLRMNGSARSGAESAGSLPEIERAVDAGGPNSGIITDDGYRVRRLAVILGLSGR